LLPFCSCTHNCRQVLLHAHLPSSSENVTIYYYSFFLPCKPRAVCVSMCVFACKWDLLENKRNTSISAMEASDRFFNQNIARYERYRISSQGGRKPVHQRRRQNVFFLIAIRFLRNCLTLFFLIAEFVVDSSEYAGGNH
jgi:hypothetical protein